MMSNVDHELRQAPLPADGADHESARAHAYELLVDAQVAERDAHEQARALANHAREAGWHDVRALADYTVALVLWWEAPRAPTTGGHVDSFIGWTQRSGDALATALALCARAAAGHHINRLANQVDDLVNAYVAAERIDATVDRAFALHEIAGGFHELHLWELTSEIYDEVERLSTGLRAPRALVGSLAFNRHYTVACELLHARESGNMAEVHRRAARVDALAAEPLNPAVPDEWRAGVAAYAAICTMLIEHAGATTIRSLLDAGPGDSIDDEEICGLLRCVLGWHHLEHGRLDEAQPLILEGARVIQATDDPSFVSFALWLLARIHNGDATPQAQASLRRYHRTLIRARDLSRDALVRSVRARLQTGRLRAERDRFARESLTDSLTGLANRRALESRLQDVSSSSTLIMVDIDQFKPVNDRYGHGVGDQVLHRIGQILLDCIRPGDLAARLGGDEFVLVLDAVDRDVAVRRGYEVRDRISTEPWHRLRDGLTVAASIGVAWGARSGVALYREADEGLYRAKRAGGARVRSGADGRSGEDPR